eukprot:g21202.t1
MVPVPLLEEAFQGIDVTLRNHITTRELLAALRVCGIFVESPAAELLLHWLHKQEQQAPGLGGGDPQNLGIIDSRSAKSSRIWLGIRPAAFGEEFMFKKASRGYQLTCRLAFLMNLSFLCVVLFSVTRPDADESWQSLLNVFGTLFALQFSAVIAVPMWRGKQIERCCAVCSAARRACGGSTLGANGAANGGRTAPEEAPDAPMQQTMSEGGRRASTDKSGRRGSTGRRGSSETGSRRGSFGTGRRGSTETGSRRGSTGTGRRGSTGTGRRGSTETGRRGSRDSGQRGSKDSGPKDSKESGHRASPDGRRSSTQSSHRGSDLGSGGSGGYTLGEDDDLMGFPSEESDSTFLFSEGGDSVSSDVMHEVQKFRMERKQALGADPKVRSPTTPLRSAGLAFKSEDEVFSYPVGRRKKPRRASSDSRAGSAAEVEEAWTEEVPKKKRRRRSQKGGRRASGGGGFFRSLLGSKEELTVVKEMSLNSQQSTGSTRSRRGNSPGSPGRRSSLGSLGTHSSSSSHRRKDSKGSKGSKGSRTNSKSSRTLGGTAWARMKPAMYDPKTYDAAAWRAAQGRNTSSFSPMQVRNLRAPDLLAPPMLHEISDLGSTTEGWGWSKVSWGQATDSQSRMVTKDAKDLRSEDVLLGLQAGVGWTPRRPAKMATGDSTPVREKGYVPPHAVPLPKGERYDPSQDGGSERPTARNADAEGDGGDGCERPSIMKFKRAVDLIRKSKPDVRASMLAGNERLGSRPISAATDKSRPFSATLSVASLGVDVIDGNSANPNRSISVASSVASHAASSASSAPLNRLRQSVRKVQHHLTAERAQNAGNAPETRALGGPGRTRRLVGDGEIKACNTWPFDT